MLRAATEAMGSIPAYAGEPSRGLLDVFRDWVYPRVRGGARKVGRSISVEKGLSPRTRGSLNRGEIDRHGAGSIPAYAGEPMRFVSHDQISWVYPRVRGGAEGGV